MWRSVRMQLCVSVYEYLCGHMGKRVCVCVARSMGECVWLQVCVVYFYTEFCMCALVCRQVSVWIYMCVHAHACVWAYGYQWLGEQVQICLGVYGSMFFYVCVLV